MDVLDLGVGAGRTSFTFAALVRTYIGIDYAQAMVEICRSRFGENDRQKFLCLDAADYPRLMIRNLILCFSVSTALIPLTQAETQNSSGGSSAVEA